MHQDAPAPTVVPLETETMVTMPVEPPIAPIVPTEKPKGSNLVWILVVVILSLIIGGAGYFVYTKTIMPKPAAPVATMAPVVAAPTVAPVVAPTATPITSSNVDQTLNSADTSVGASVDQANTDLNTVNSINSTQDTNSGL